MSNQKQQLTQQQLQHKKNIKANWTKRWQKALETKNIALQNDLQKELVSLELE